MAPWGLQEARRAALCGGLLGWIGGETVGASARVYVVMVGLLVCFRHLVGILHYSSIMNACSQNYLEIEAVQLQSKRMSS